MNASLNFANKLTGQTQLTKTGSTMGTPAYMSPEQIMGGQVDGRSDIWSFGVIFYEMLAGELPFKGDYEQALMYSILHEEPELVSTLRPDVPAYLEQIVLKTLVKEQSARYQSIEELKQDLANRSSATTKATASKKSIVVLPFDDISPNKDNEYFSDGLTEEIITDLSKIQTLRVISRTSAKMLKGTEKDLKTIGRELNVQLGGLAGRHCRESGVACITTAFTATAGRRRSELVLFIFRVPSVQNVQCVEIPPRVKRS